MGFEVERQETMGLAVGGEVGDGGEEVGRVAVGV